MGTAAVQQKRRKPRERVVLSITETARIRHRLNGTINGQPSAVGYTCSDAWARVCIRALESGKVAPRKKLQHLEQDLHKAGVYPPGGSATAMVESQRTLRWMPPDYTGRPLDDREDRLTVAEGCKLPGSVSAQAIDRIRHMKARPMRDRTRVGSR